MAVTDQAQVQLRAEQVEQLGRTAIRAAERVCALDFTAMRPSARSADTFVALASCVTPANTTTHVVGTRFASCGSSIVGAAALLTSADILMISS